MLKTNKPKGTEVTVRHRMTEETTPAVVTDDDGTVRKDEGDAHRPAFSAGVYEVVEDES